MAAELKDLRVKFTPEAMALVRAEAAVRNCHPNEVVRDIVERWADHKLHVLSLADEDLRRQGYRGLAQGRTGRRRDDEVSLGFDGDSRGRTRR